MDSKNNIEGIDTQKSAVITVNIMKRLFRAPNPIIMLIPILFFSTIFGIILGDSSSSYIDNIILYGIFLFALPTLLSGIFSKPICELLGGVLYYRRSMLLSFITMLLVGFIVIVIKIVLNTFFVIEFNILFIFAYSFTIWIRHLVILTTSNGSHLRSLPITFIQPIIAVVILNYINPLYFKEYLLIGLFFIIFFSASLLFISLINLPMKKNFNWNGFELLSHSLAHITEGKAEGADELERFFESFSSKMDVPIHLIGFKADSKIKALMIVPIIHPGPFGEIGGSNLSFKLYTRLKDVSKNILVPHSATGHDYNLAVSSDCDKIAEEIRNLVNDMKFETGGSKFIRCHDDIDICAQELGNSILFVHTSSPNPTDDIDPAIGQLINSGIGETGRSEAIFVDAHNCLKKGTGCVYLNTNKSNKIFELSRKAAKISLKNTFDKIQMGYSQKNDFDINNYSIGPQGIQVLTIKNNEHLNSYILFDGNNMVMGLREDIIKSLDGLVNDAEILTSDNHIVNVKIGGYNPIGLNSDKKELIKIVKKLVKYSINDLEDVTVGVKSGIVNNIKLFGYGNSARIISTINSILSTLKINTISTLSLASLLCIIIYILIVE